MQSNAPPPERPPAPPAAAGPPDAPRRPPQRSPSRSTTTGSVAAVGATRRAAAPRRRPRPAKTGPSVALLLWPFGAGTLAVLLASFHSAMGAPFGAKFAAELWDTCKQVGIVLLAYGPFAGFAHRANKNALAGGDGRGYALGDGDGTEEAARGGGQGGQRSGGEEDVRDNHHDDDRRRRT